MYNNQSVMLLIGFSYISLSFITFKYQRHTDCGYEFTEYYYMLYVIFMFLQYLLHFTCLYMHSILLYIFHALFFGFSNFDN